MDAGVMHLKQGIDLISLKLMSKVIGESLWECLAPTTLTF